MITTAEWTGIDKGHLLTSQRETRYRTGVIPLSPPSTTDKVFPPGTRFVVVEKGNDQGQNYIEVCQYAPGQRVVYPGDMAPERPDYYRVFADDLQRFQFNHVLVTLKGVSVTFMIDPESVVVDPIWNDVDRPNVGGISCGHDSPKARDLAMRTSRAILDGKAVRNPNKVKVDTSGLTFASSCLQLRGRALNADLKALGY